VTDFVYDYIADPLAACCQKLKLYYNIFKIYERKLV